jgi:peptide/nickel transport system permease protein
MRTNPDRASLPKSTDRGERAPEPGRADPLDERHQPGHTAPAPPPESADEPAWSAAPLAANEGRIVAVPAFEPEGATQGAGSGAVETAGAKIGGQWLTGRAARVTIPAVSLSPTQLAWRKLRKNRLAVAGGIVLILLYAIALFAPFIAPYTYASQDPVASFRPPMAVHFTPWPTIYPSTSSFNEYRERTYVEDQSQPRPLRFFVKGEPYRLFGLVPCARHLFEGSGGTRVYLLGTDEFGRDYLSRLLYGAQISLSVGLIGIAITFTLGLLVGGASGYYGGWVDDVTMRSCEVIMSVPDFYLLLALAATLPPTLPPAEVYILIIAILSFVGWAGMARIIRGMVLSVREREYVEAARALGVSDFKIIVRHVLPSTFTYAIVAATLTGYILAESSLSFLGLGIRDPLPSWGNMLSAAQNLSTLEQRTWILAPGLMIFVTTLAFNFLGDGLRDALDPKSR